MDNIRKLTMHSPDCKWTEAEIFSQEPPILEQDFLASTLTGWRIPEWRSVASGSEQVFSARIALDKSRPNRFGMAMTFYETIRYWVALA